MALPVWPELREALDPYVLPPLASIIFDYAAEANEVVTTMSRVDGLQKIYFSAEGFPNAAFVFDSAEKAQAAAKTVIGRVRWGGTCKVHRGILFEPKYSEGEADRTISYTVMGSFMASPKVDQLKTQNGFLEKMQDHMPQGIERSVKIIRVYLQ